MKYYIFTTHTVISGEDLGINNRLFVERDMALDALKAWRDDEINYVKRDEWLISEDTEDSFEAYEDGYYTTNHTEGYVQETELE